MSSTIKFNRHNVTNKATGEKARAWYSIGNRIDGRACVTIYAKYYGHDLARVMGDAAEYTNDSDLMTDYFEKGRVVLFADHPLYAAALEAAQAAEAARAARWEAYRTKHGLAA